jgi:hypothetical protein
MTVPDLLDPPENGLAFVESVTFSPLADEFLGDDGRDALQKQILKNPKAGRVIYYYQDAEGRVHFLLLYPKNQQENLSASDKKMLKAWIEKIDLEG